MSNAFDTTNSPITEPTEINAGDYTAWRRLDLSGDYPPASYTLEYQCRSASTPSHRITITATESDGDYLVELSSATTLDYETGNYHWSAFIKRISDGARVEVDSGVFTVLSDKATSAEDPRSLPLRMLAKIEDAIESRADNQQLDVLAYSLNIDVSATRDPAQLLKHRAYWQRELVKANRQKAAREGRRHSGKIGVQF